MIKIDKFLIENLRIKVSTSARKRCNFNFHHYSADPLQRMLNIMNSDTYVRPHKHENPDKREAFIILEGKVAVVEFNMEGDPANSIILDRNSGNFGCEIEPKTWHTIICLEDNSVLYEVKDGPYDVSTDKIFAPWAPEEGESGTEEFNNRIKGILGL